MLYRLLLEPYRWLTSSPTQPSRRCAPHANGTPCSLGAPLSDARRSVLTHHSTSTGPHPLLTLFASPTVALFTPLANACFLQISGTPVSELKPRYLLEEELKRGQKRPRKRSSRVGKRKRREADLDDSNQPTEDREATVEATPPPSPPSLAIRTPNQSPIKRLRTLGPSISAPELLSPRRPLAPLRSLVFPPTQAVDKTTLRPTQSSASILGGVKRGAELKSGAKDVKRKKLETL